jgi:hypothetical protein
MFVVRCYADLRTARGRMFSQVLAILQIGSFGIVAVAYGTIWIKIQRTARLMSSDDGRYRNSARVMMIFVLTFIFQVCLILQTLTDGDQIIV